MEQALKTLVRKRGSVKTRITLFKNYLESIQLQINAKEQLDDDVLIELEHRVEKQELLPNEFEEIQSEIECLVEKPEEQLTERQLFETNYYSSNSLAKKILKQFSNKVSNYKKEVDNVKLPTIHLPQFNGNYNDWLEFRDTFESLIHTNTSISTIQKFHYLRSCLEGGAAQVVKSLEFSATNYSIAWQILCDRYNNKQLLIQNHIQSIFNISSMQKESASKLREMLDNLSKHLRSLQTLKQPTEYWDTVIIYVMSNKLDSHTLRKWEEHKTTYEIPTLNDFTRFIKSRADLLETIKPDKHKNHTTVSSSISYLSNGASCNLCKSSHFIQSCAEFLKLSVNNRIEKIRELKLCLNCLRSKHSHKFCKYGRCKKCKRRHNTLLHVDNETTTEEKSNQNVSLSNTIFANKIQQQVLLSTVYIKVFDSQRRIHYCKAILDSASQSNFITNKLCNKLNIEMSNFEMNIVGINQVLSTANFKCNVDIQSCYNDFCVKISCIVIPKISEYIPEYKINLSMLNFPKNIRLADPTFNEPSEIDMLIGAELFWHLLCIGQIHMGKNQPVLQKTKFGWIVSGPIDSNNYIKQTRCHFSKNLEIQDQLTKFWELENPSTTSNISISDKECELHFINTLKRDENGRFVVSIPFRESLNMLGVSKQTALKRFYSIERKLQTNSELKEKYVAFMREYKELGHMSKISDSDVPEFSYYMPHHGVLREERITTKLRVVFDGSAPSDSGYSINDLQHVGPTIQDDLLSIMLRFRQHSYVVSADITKMYRQVLITTEQRSLQRIFWREDPSQTLDIYNLNTVTYGTASAPFLAIRCLQQLAHENKQNYPVASNVILRDFYVDDLITGGDKIEEVSKLCTDITAILRKGCFELCKWVSNKPDILSKIQPSNLLQSMLNFGENQNTKTLGLWWSCNSDTLFYKMNDISLNKVITKRIILSSVAQIFDPLGILSPCTIIAKLIMQKLWLCKLSWDESVPSDVHTKWVYFKNELPKLSELQIPRQVVCKEPSLIELHGFCDASEEAYGAVIYIRSVDQHKNINVHLLCAKAKVAPLKRISIPRLELCGALVLSQLVRKVTKSLTINIKKITLWCDSTIVLGWLKLSSHLLKTFVSNRVTEILENTSIESWQHVDTKNNPADLLSRGVMPNKLKESCLWWNGPPWLSNSKKEWPLTTQMTQNSDLPEIRNQKHVFHTSNEKALICFTNFSNLNKLKRITAWCLRFTTNLSLSKESKLSGGLKSNELHNALTILLKFAQNESFPEELKTLRQNKSLSSKNRLLSLNPFIDSEGLIRVGGRLKNSDFNYDKKHPILLCNKHHLTKLIFLNEHLRLLHAGPQLLLYSIRNKFWPLSGRNLSKQTVHNCIKCFRNNPRHLDPIMGNLPKSRIQPEPPFYNTGVDYAGPISIKDRYGRTAKTLKGYICLFVCFTTKAVHLELVSSLTAEAFISTLRRFISRRGKPSNIYSDNGTNFVGANANLKELGKFFKNHEMIFTDALASEGVNWHFIPPQSPHFGGLWEAGIKSTKTHLKRVIGNALLNFEELTTLLTQIESILNSRPLTPMSSDVNDMRPLTPAHFLIGKPLSDLPERSLIEVKENRLSRYQRIQQIKQHFWKRWSLEYISQLQQRTKWKQNNTEIEIGTMVLVKEENLPPLNWQLGRVVEIHPGPDNIIRVVSIKTHKGTLKRSLSKICPLPMDTTVG